MSRQHGNESTHLAKAESSKGDYSKKGPGIWINCEFKWLCKLKDIMRSLVSKLFFFLIFILLSLAPQVGEDNESDYPVIGHEDATFQVV